MNHLTCVQIEARCNIVMLTTVLLTGLMLEDGRVRDTANAARTMCCSPCRDSPRILDSWVMLCPPN